MTDLFFIKNKESTMKTRVARYQADRTNQKLYFSRIYCQLAEQAPKGQLQDAHIESALMHLYGGYLAFLQEIARYYHLTLTHPTLHDIESQLAQRTQVSPEVLRLQNLLAHDFLAEIEQAWQQIMYKPVPKDTLALADIHADNRLPIIDVMANSAQPSVSVDMVRQWRLALLETIDKLREGMVEF